MRFAEIIDGQVVSIGNGSFLPFFDDARICVEITTETGETSIGGTWDGVVFTLGPGPELERLRAIDANIEKLWQAAHDYEYAQISGSAIGLLAVGVLQSKPKCVAVELWIKAVWTLYYSRKPQITEIFESSLCDFSSCGPIPFSIPELMAEIGF
jgi:hypothetical protein